MMEGCSVEPSCVVATAGAAVVVAAVADVPESSLGSLAFFLEGKSVALLMFDMFPAFLAFKGFAPFVDEVLVVDVVDVVVFGANVVATVLFFVTFVLLLLLLLLLLMILLPPALGLGVVAGTLTYFFSVIIFQVPLV